MRGKSRMVNSVDKVQDIIWRRIADEVVVLRDNGLSTHVLNKTAAHIWELCDGRHGTDEIVDSLCKRFDVDYEQARADAEEIIGKLIQIGILNQSKETTVERAVNQN
jgi:hypothetical protein